MSEGSIQWANVSHMAAYPLEPSDLELGSPSQVHWSEKIKHQILLLRLQRRDMVGFLMVRRLKNFELCFQVTVNVLKDCWTII